MIEVEMEPPRSNYGRLMVVPAYQDRLFGRRVLMEITWAERHLSHGRFARYSDIKRDQWVEVIPSHQPSFVGRAEIGDMIEWIAEQGAGLWSLRIFGVYDDRNGGHITALSKYRFGFDDHCTAVAFAMLFSK